ncbi:hypothetical protein JOD46_000346 [Agromyces aurantiacus]|nr:hypothetical protein [Agromyces aurantiacus]
MHFRQSVGVTSERRSQACGLRHIGLAGHMTASIADQHTSAFERGPATRRVSGRGNARRTIRGRTTAFHAKARATRADGRVDSRPRPARSQSRRDGAPERRRTKEARVARPQRGGVEVAEQPSDVSRRGHVRRPVRRDMPVHVRHRGPCAHGHTGRTLNADRLVSSDRSEKSEEPSIRAKLNGASGRGALGPSRRPHRSGGRPEPFHVKRRADQTVRSERPAVHDVVSRLHRDRVGNSMSQRARDRFGERRRPTSRADRVGSSADDAI